MAYFHPKMEDIIQKLSLQPLWGKDFLKECYFSDLEIPLSTLPDEFDGKRLLYTFAYYLLPQGTVCPFHLMYSDESWQYCLGSPMKLYLISPQGELQTIVVGPDLENGHHLLTIIPAGYWFAAELYDKQEYSLITHFVSPGFKPQDWEKGYSEKMRQLFPKYSELINRLAWPDDK